MNRIGTKAFKTSVLTFNGYSECLPALVQFLLTCPWATVRIWKEPARDASLWGGENCRMHLCTSCCWPWFHHSKAIRCHAVQVVSMDCDDAACQGSVCTLNTSFLDHGVRLIRWHLRWCPRQRVGLKARYTSLFRRRISFLQKKTRDLLCTALRCHGHCGFIFAESTGQLRKQKPNCFGFKKSHFLIFSLTATVLFSSKINQVNWNASHQKLCGLFSLKVMKH